MQEITTALYHIYYARKALVRALHFCGDERIKTILDEVRELHQEALEKWIEKKRKKK